MERHTPAIPCYLDDPLTQGHALTDPSYPAPLRRRDGEQQTRETAKASCSQGSVYAFLGRLQEACMATGRSYSALRELQKHLRKPRCDFSGLVRYLVYHGLR